MYNNNKASIEVGGTNFTAQISSSRKQIKESRKGHDENDNNRFFYDGLKTTVEKIAELHQASPVNPTKLFITAGTDVFDKDGNLSTKPSSIIGTGKLLQRQEHPELENFYTTDSNKEQETIDLQKVVDHLGKAFKLEPGSIQVTAANDVITPLLTVLEHDNLLKAGNFNTQVILGTGAGFGGIKKTESANAIYDEGGHKPVAFRGEYKELEGESTRRHFRGDDTVESFLAGCTMNESRGFKETVKNILNNLSKGNKTTLEKLNQAIQAIGDQGLNSEDLKNSALLNEYKESQSYHNQDLDQKAARGDKLAIAINHLLLIRLAEQLAAQDLLPKNLESIGTTGTMINNALEMQGRGSEMVSSREAFDNAIQLLIKDPQTAIIDRDPAKLQNASAQTKIKIYANENVLSQGLELAERDKYFNAATLETIA